MSANELRKDYLLDRWVVIAAKRKRRPTDFAKKAKEETSGVCPFCPGNEHMTPPAILVYLPSNGSIRKERDRNGFRHKNWLVRCVPNLYPAFTPLNEQEKARVKESPVLARAIGHHEVLVESPRHDEHPAVARIPQLVHVINAYLDRLNELSAKNYVKYVSIFRNHRPEAGVSLSHAHTQLISTPFLPRIVSEELGASRRYWIENKRCTFCEILTKEKDSPRFIWENDSFVAFAPWASVHPFEFWVFPKSHQSALTDISRTEIEDLAVALRACLGGLSSLLEDPPYNFGFHIALKKEDSDHYHWHLEVYPKLTIWAGFEKNTGMFINVVPPKDAARNLREAVQKETKSL
ncbi:galactose-1-phosphate uridylyltransferase [Candidatus Bathyarchaeota archaeon]|nr:galactose-1-phosphate uridylyltransferase [Candidatus Bathyarchaeota archaeon]